MSTQVNVNVIVVDAGGNFQGNSRPIRELVDDEHLAQTIESLVSTQGNVLDMIRFIRAIRSGGSLSGFLDYINSDRLPELVDATRAMIDAYKAIEDGDAVTVGDFIDSFANFLAVAAEVTTWTIDDGLARIVNAAVTDGPVRDLVIKLLLRFIFSTDNSVENTVMAVVMDNDMPKSAAFNWADLFALLNFLYKVWRSS